ncbi:DNA polymerase III, delta prime subunit [Desulfosporosinus acidiphilus SJ4]|uniref:DNA polymerase III, delta prime subunit n=1 Tax=Desulfosporosinus acidiphilus (strain DSM 22704 / JCM 16185 / SJ4) TaxID=646529 RepID=I4D022_DESAJ|nr:DNA polymerase III subunit delta' [Desulfosporosinus acidiphilus]AFM39146.1 DNA polymerase III, delta prime subunit [Desulfosporosinus acidiphilus SJ4]
MNPAQVLLEKAAREDHLAHLLLFHGGSELYRRQEALRIAQILNCSSPKQESPCQICMACHKILSYNHPDILWLKPLKTTIGIEQVLAWQGKVYLKNYEGNYKVSIIEQADSLTLPAANALLKVIEEPPEHSVIILSAGNAEGILPTIQSRAQLIYFPDLPNDEWIKELGDTDQQESKLALELSGKNQTLAAAILEQGVFSLQEWVHKFFKVVEDKDFLALFSLFPLDKTQANVYLQALAVQIQEGIRKGTNRPFELLAIGKANEALRQQVNPRLVIEVLALELFQQGGVLCD